MKFLAMLKDSLREAADATVLYVMLGLSGLLILIGATMTFTPTPGAAPLMTLCAAPLNVDLEKIDQLQAGNNPMQLLQHVRGDSRLASRPASLIGKGLPTAESAEPKAQIVR